MDLESIKKLNTPHFCQWYLKRLQHILDREKWAEYSGMPCESFDDLSKIVEHSQYQGKWDVRAKQWVSNDPVIYCHARIAGTDSIYETKELTEDFILRYGISLVPFFPNYIKEYKVLTPAAECSTIETKQEEKEMSKIVDAIAAYMGVMSEPLYSLPNITRSTIYEAGECKSFAALAQKLKEGGALTSDSRYRAQFNRDFADLVWYDYHTNKIVSLFNLGNYGFLLPVPKSALPKGDISVLFMSNATSISKGNKLMSIIKETAIKSKDQVIKTAIGQAGVAGIKSLILTALPMKIGFIGRLLGRHRQIANNSVVVAGIAILANQIGQQYVKNNSVKNALQATQDQALSEVLNEYVGIENKVDSVVTNALQLDKQPVTLDQD